nr:heavy metal-associated domain-containing protein [Sporolactobacillus kofuensis]
MAVLAFQSLVRSIRSGCCGSGRNALKKIKVHDRDPRHYSNVALIRISGMTCQNCALRIENALNALQDVDAEVYFEKKEAIVRMQKSIPERIVSQVVSKVGYTVTAISKINN